MVTGERLSRGPATVAVFTMFRKDFFDLGRKAYKRADHAFSMNSAK